jgi:hypothetical protein
MSRRAIVAAGALSGAPPLATISAMISSAFMDALGPLKRSAKARRPAGAGCAGRPPAAARFALPASGVRQGVALTINVGKV